jgi:pSer/pThr/pTyr-binding forkhead associated (FHA) protein
MYDLTPPAYHQLNDANCAVPHRPAASARVAPEAVDQPATPLLRTRPGNDTVLVTIVLEIEGKQVVLPTNSTVIIGRIKPDSTAPAPVIDVDLSPFNAYAYGVSRRHVQIIRDSSVRVLDLGSTNGTFLNGQRLGPIALPLCDNDEIQLGQLKARVRFQR